MGYETSFKITVEPRSTRSLLEAIVEKIENLDNCYPYVNSQGNAIHASCKWYEHEDDMRIVSTHFPEIVITVNGDGEESGDLWRRYYKNGKCQKAETRITFTEFNESLLE